MMILHQLCRSATLINASNQYLENLTIYYQLGQFLININVFIEISIEILFIRKKKYLKKKLKSLLMQIFKFCKKKYYYTSENLILTLNYRKILSTRLYLYYFSTGVE